VLATIPMKVAGDPVDQAEIIAFIAAQQATKS
jgi:hypothetical protein